MSGKIRSVFVIGDSISVQYGPYLERFVTPHFGYRRKCAAEGTTDTNLDIPSVASHNGGDSSMVLEYLRDNDRHKQISHPDYLLVNCGLHDIKTDPSTGSKQVDPGAYRANLEGIVEIARPMCETLVWIRTTPCDEHVHNKPRMEFHRFRSDCNEYNRIADEVMSQYGVDSIDLHTHTEATGEDLYCDHVHFNEPVRVSQAAFIAGWLNGHNTRDTTHAT